jgi:hypothetical protein
MEEAIKFVDKEIRYLEYQRYPKKINLKLELKIAKLRDILRDMKEVVNM